MALPGEMCPVKLFPGEWCPVKLFPGEMCPVTCRKGVFDDRVVEACAFEKMSLMKDKMLADLFFTGFDSGLSPTTQADTRHMLLQQCPFPPKPLPQICAGCTVHPAIRGCVGCGLLFCHNCIAQCFACNDWYHTPHCMASLPQIFDRVVDACAFEKKCR